MFNSKKYVVSILGGILIISSFTSSFAFANSNYKDSNKPLSQEIIATVNGEPIYYSEFKNKLAVGQITGKNPKDLTNTASGNNQLAAQELLQKMILQKVVKQNANKMGLTVTMQEAKDEVLKTHQQIKKLLNSENEDEKASAESTWKSYKNTLSNLKMTEQEYENQYEIPAMQSILLDNRHYELFLQKNASKSMTHEQTVKLYKNYLSELKERSTISVNDSFLK